MYSGIGMARDSPSAGSTQSACQFKVNSKEEGRDVRMDVQLRAKDLTVQFELLCGDCASQWFWTEIHVLELVGPSGNVIQYEVAGKDRDQIRREVEGSLKL